MDLNILICPSFHQTVWRIFSPPASENNTAHAPFHSDIRGDITVAASSLPISGETINNPAELRVPGRFHRLPNRGGA